MRHTLLAGVAISALLLGPALPALAQAPLPVPGVEPARDVPGAKEMPDPKIVHKVVFDLATASPKPGEVHPLLQAVARYVNTLAKVGVPEEERLFGSQVLQEPPVEREPPRKLLGSIDPLSHRVGPRGCNRPERVGRGN